MKTKPRRSTPSAWVAARRELARRDRELFAAGGRSRPGVTRNDQYLQLWDRILLRLGEVLARECHVKELDTLEDLSRALAAAQSRQQLPPALVRRVLTGTASHGTSPPK